MIILKTKKQIAGIRTAGHILAQALDYLESLIRPGITTKELDTHIRAFLGKRRALPTFLNYDGFPAALCTSVNDTVIHGIPANTPLEEGDVIGCDLGVSFNGYISDACRTFPVGTISPEAKELIQVTKEALRRGIAIAVPGNRVKDIGQAITEWVAPHNYGIVHAFCGHGVGLELHESPQIPNTYPSRGSNPRLRAGMVLAIEPMINLGSPEVEILDDGWTVKTIDRRLSAHCEHTVAILEHETLIATIS